MDNVDVLGIEGNYVIQRCTADKGDEVPADGKEEERYVQM
jgi:hypothetical protein